MAGNEKKQKTQRFAVIRLMDFKDEIERLREHNPQYDLSVSELAEQGLMGERIYEDLYTAAKVELKYHAEPAAKKDAASGKSAAQDSSSSKADSSAERIEQDEILVLADGKQIGFIKPGAAAQVKDILDKEVVRSVSLDLKGGTYKILNPDDTGSFQAEHETVSLYGSVIITSEEKEAPKASSESAGMKSYIDTSYSLAQSRRDPRTLGYIPLLLAGMISAFYLAFSIPYWYFVHQGRAQVFTFISELLTEQDIFIHLCAVLAALLLTILAMAVKSRFWTFLAMLAYAFSAGWPVYVTKDPWYLLPGAVLAFFCLVAFVRKRG